ncbi:unnamed protein product, partial [Didymodactylos carnosus]
MVGQGFLRESDLEDYIYELIPTMQQSAQLQETYHRNKKNKVGLELLK